MYDSHPKCWRILNEPRVYKLLHYIKIAFTPLEVQLIVQQWFCLHKHSIVTIIIFFPAAELGHTLYIFQKLSVFSKSDPLYLLGPAVLPVCGSLTISVSLLHLLSKESTIFAYGQLQWPFQGKIQIEFYYENFILWVIRLLLFIYLNRLYRYYK